ncbi:MAG: LysR family transcriptional regulator [Alphaproteobacteria bacterium]|nr:LysR family transcriptional regulator [Alphaproteobacteria bacterium]
MSDWDGYRVFLAVAETGSLSAAARTLRLSQPTVGRAIAALERRLGTRLFLRQARGLTPTPAGAALMEPARRMAEAAARVPNALAGGGIAASEPVRISCTEGIGILWLTAKLRELNTAHPEIPLSLIIDNLAVDLARRQADIAVRLFRPREPDLIAKRVGLLVSGLYASADYVKAHGVPRRMSDLKRHRFVGQDHHGATMISPQARWLGRQIGDRPLAFASNSLVAQYRAIRLGWGIGLVPPIFFRGDPDLVRVLPEADTPRLEIWLAVHADLRRDPRIALVYDTLGDLLRRDRRALADGAAERP